ncbi:MAG: peptide ABC transporter substrate-binding protein [Chloroflexota bacterium]|nr:MAG: peptide ABC transporter substrate-binding protein [Chloroflexota bacterium]
MLKKRSFLLLILALALSLAACGGGAAQPESEKPADTAPTQSTQTEATTAAPAETSEAKTEATAAPAETTEPAPATEEAAAASGGTLRFGWNGSPDTLNPGTFILYEAYVIADLVYDTMFDLQLDGTFKPSLAESYDVSADGKTWTFKIKSGVKFHDGQPLTAKDVAFTYNYYRSHPDFPYMVTYGEKFESVEATDDTTVVIKLTDAIPNIEAQLYAQYVLPEHIWSKYEEATAAVEFENLEMIGSGAFKMVEYKQNEFVHLAANKDYFDGAPKVDEVIFQTFGNPDALVQALTTGQVDVIRDIPSTAVPTLRNNADIGLVIGAPRDPSVRDIILNQLAPENCPPEDGKCTGHPALRDRNVRLALAHATDKQNIIDVAMLGLATPGLTLVPDSMGHWYNNTLEDYAYDPAQANQILDDAGYKDTDGDGVREMPDGSKPLSFRLYWPNDVGEAPRIADLLADSWNQAGIKVEPQAFDPDALTTACCPAFDYDIMIWGWAWGPDPDGALQVYRTSDIVSGYNETGYASSKFDELYQQQSIELDPQKRRDIVWEMQKMTFEDVVYIIPYYQQDVQAYRKDRFQGWMTDVPKVALEDFSQLMIVQPVQ